MMEYIIVEGETYDEALIKGLTSLDLSEDQVEIHIVEEKKSFLFKKGFVKLKLVPISMNNIDFESSENLDNDEENQLQLDQQQFIVDSSLEISISEDQLQTAILLTKPINGKTMSTAEILDDLDNHKVKYGILNDKIEEIVNHKIFNQFVIVAQGKVPVPGRDGQVHYTFGNELESRNTIIHEDGTIDYKNLDKIRNVNEGTLLLEIIPPTKGINGMDIYGNEILASNGKEVLIKKGKNVKESEDGLKIYAAKDGEVHFADNTIYVDEVINIDRNIDNETGNIQFNGKVNIKGNVKSGFKVEAEGDIEVWGVVEGAILISNGNIILHRGVQGNNQANLYCFGNLTAKYIENSTIKCGGNIESDVILHSDVTTKGKITASGRKGLIAGGDLKVGREVRANVIGSSMGTITNIEVGIDPEEKKHYENIKSEMLDIEKNIDNSQKAIELLNKLSKKQQLTKDKQELFVKSLNTYKVLKAKHDAVSKEIQELKERFKDANNGKVHAIKTIHTGVKITIGSCTKHIYDDLSNCTISIKNGEVAIGAYEK